jgi:hypothetical protein
MNAELLKVEDPILLNKIYKIITNVRQLERLSPEWEEGILCPIYKKGTL